MVGGAETGLTSFSEKAAWVRVALVPTGTKVLRKQYFRLFTVLGLHLELMISAYK